MPRAISVAADFLRWVRLSLELVATQGENPFSDQGQATMLAEPSPAQSALATCPLSEHPPEICRAAEPAADPEAEQPAEQQPPAVFTQEQLPPPPPKMPPPPPPEMLLDIWTWASDNCEAGGSQSILAGLRGIEPIATRLTGPRRDHKDHDNYSVSDLVCKEDAWQ